LYYIRYDWRGNPSCAEHPSCTNARLPGALPTLMKKLKEMEKIYSLQDNTPHRNKKPMSLEKLVEAILKLEEDKIITFEDFKNLGYKKIQEQYFGMTTSTQMDKALIKIHDQKMGKTGQSTLTIKEITINANGKIKIKETTHFF